MDKEIDRAIKEKEDKIKNIESLIKKQIKLEMEIEFCKDERIRQDTERFVGQTSSQIKKAKHSVGIEREVLEKMLDELYIYFDVRDDLTDEYFKCENCWYKNNWPDGSKITPDDNAHCGLQPEYNQKNKEDMVDISLCLNSANFTPYASEARREYKKKLTYLNKKIAGLNKK